MGAKLIVCIDPALYLGPWATNILNNQSRVADKGW